MQEPSAPGGKTVSIILVEILCSQQGSNVDRLQAQLLLLVLPNVASSQLLVVRVSDGSADW